MRERCISALGLLAVSLLGMHGSASGARAQVDETSPFFEIDGDFGSILEDVDLNGIGHAEGGDTYLPHTLDVSDGGDTAWGRRQNSTCSNWSHAPFEPYMGHDSYRVHCDEQQDPICLGAEPPARCTRRAEQMVLNDWWAGPNSTRYFTLAFRLTTLPTIAADESKRGYIAQWHQGGQNGPPIQLSWSMFGDGSVHLKSGVRGQWADGTMDYQELIPEDFPAIEQGVWYRVLYQVDLGAQTNGERCPLFDENHVGQVRAWLMNSKTGAWEILGEMQGAVGYVDVLNDRNRATDPRVPRVGSDCNFQWKLGIYANSTDLITVHYDNVAYANRWYRITKNYLTGYHKNVLSLPFDEGLGLKVHDASWRANGGQEGTAYKDYDNDGQVRNERFPRWNRTQGVSNGSLHFDGSYDVTVPINTAEADFDFGNYVTVSAWVRPDHATSNKGIVMVDRNSNNWKALMYMSDGLIGFGVRHPDNSYSKLNYTAFSPGQYVDGNWHHIVGTYNRFGADGHGVLTLYVDGVPVGEPLVTPSLPVARGEYEVAVGRYSNSGYFVGDIDEVNLFNHAWPAEDVAAHYEALRP